MELQELEAWLADWDLPLGPFKTIEDVYEDMEVQARALGPSAAPTLARFAAQLAQVKHPRLQVLSIFLQTYAELHPEEFAEALLRELTPEGPPLLLDLLGSTGVREAIPRIAATLDIDSANEVLLVAWACALGDLGGTEAAKLLSDLKARPNLPKSVEGEIETSFQRM